MLPKENRLARREDFSRVYEQGQYFRQGDVAIKFIRTKNSLLRIGFSVGKNYSKLAIRRNRARRILREAIRKRLPDMQSGSDIVVMLQAAPKNSPKNKAGLSEIEKDLEIIFSKTNLYK
jgi:ribonuclease P protein component